MIATNARLSKRFISRVSGQKNVTRYSKSIVEQAGVRKESFGLTDNVIAEQELLIDSDRKRIRAILRKVTSYDVVAIDIKDGNVWWVTRLLALCAGAADGEIGGAFGALGFLNDLLAEGIES